jgi:isopenicillin N synthase-like dioxygenase
MIIVLNSSSLIFIDTSLHIMAAPTKLAETVQWNGKSVPVYAMETVSFERLLSQEPAEVEKVLQCCMTAGFFYLDMSGIDGRRMLEDQQNTLDLMHRFFESPLEAKNQYGMVAPHLGYEPVGSRTGVFDDTKDGYEMIKISRDEIQRESPHIPTVLKNSPDMKVVETAIGGCNIVTKTILSALSTGMGLTGAARFENTHRNDRPSSTTLAMMHYIPSELAGDHNAGHQKHTDISTLTLLFSEQWGLQIRPPGAREFGFVRPEPGCAIVNVGDSLRFASGHKMQSCIHRVVPFNPTEHRYSIAYFLRAEDDTMFTDSEGRYITAGQWHDEKFFAFNDSAEGQALALPTMLLGGMKEEVDPEETVHPTVMRNIAVQA